MRPAWYALLILGVVAYQVITRLARRGGGPQIGPHERGWWLNPLIVAVVLFALVYAVIWAFAKLNPGLG